jgi:transposase
MPLAQFLRKHGIKVVLVNPHHVKKSKELDDNSPTKNDKKDAVIARLIKDGRYTEPHLPTYIYAELRVAMVQRDRLIGDLNRVKGRIHNWLDRFFPEYIQVFKDWEGKASLLTLKKFPFPQDVVNRSADEIVAVWKTAVKRAVGWKREDCLIHHAKQSIGLTEGIESSRFE